MVRLQRGFRRWQQRALALLGGGAAMDRRSRALTVARVAEALRPSAKWSVEPVAAPARRRRPRAVALSCAALAAVGYLAARREPALALLAATRLLSAQAAAPKAKSD